MSLFTYTKKPNFISDGKLNNANAAATIFASSLGWVAPVAGKFNKPTTAMTVTTDTTCTVDQVAHGLVLGQFILVTGAVPATLNGYVQVSSVTNVDKFVYITLANSATATTQGAIAKNVEVVVACSDLRNAGADIAVLPVFTAAVTCPDGTLTAMVAGKTIRCTLTMSEPVEVRGFAQVQFVVAPGALVRQAKYNQAVSTSTSLVFDYVIPTPATNDVSAAGQIVFTATTNGGQIADVLPKSRTAIVAVSFTAPGAATATIA